MRIAILTSEILDGKIAAQTLINAGKDIRAVIYEKKHNPLKAKARLWLLFLTGKLSALSFEGIARPKKILVRSTDNINQEENIALLKTIGPELIVVVGTRKLKKEVFSTARRGAINLHSGILPAYRGADSEFWALYNNQPEMVGVTIHFIEETLDSGDIILQERQRVEDSDTHNSLRRKNILLGSVMLGRAISLIESGDFPRLKQDTKAAHLYPSATREGLKKFRLKGSRRKRDSAIFKSFAFGALKAEEKVAKSPIVEFASGREVDYPGTFTLRIDADEYDSRGFSSFLPVFKKQHKAITIFINAASFSGAQTIVGECKDMGLDVQSHGFYHYTYKDYFSNRQNIKKAGDFFKKMGIITKGFAAPYGKWNRGLMRALEDENYEYSSDFAYDYLGYPTYPGMGNRISTVLEIPIFPVAPELFFQQRGCGVEDVFAYYKNAIESLDACGIPVIIYAHTSKFKEVPNLLEKLVEYALFEKRLFPLNMSGLCAWWKNKHTPEENRPPIRKKQLILPQPDLLGRPLRRGAITMLKTRVKDAIDFERATPDNEICCREPRKTLKVWSKKIIPEKGIEKDKIG